VRCLWRFSDRPDQVAPADLAWPQQGGRLVGLEHHQSSTLLPRPSCDARLVPFELLWLDGPLSRGRPLRDLGGLHRRPAGVQYKFVDGREHSERGLGYATAATLDLGLLWAHELRGSGWGGSPRRRRSVGVAGLVQGLRIGRMPPENGRRRPADLARAVAYQHHRGRMILICDRSGDHLDVHGTAPAW
jgi:hypothetical protein